MNYRECSRLLDQIIWGNIMVPEHHLVLHIPTAEIKAKSSLVYNKALIESLEYGLLSENELIEQYVQWGQWSYEIDQEIEGIKNDIHIMKKGLLDYFLHTTQLEKIRKTIRNAEHSMIQRLIKKYELTKNSAESNALLGQQKFIISKITYLEDGLLKWRTEEDFNNEIDFLLINKLINIFFEESRLSNSILRQIARSSVWRSLWVSSKHSENLFNIKTSDWSDTQKDLIYWSHVYDTVFDAYERPMKEIIEDDDLLDSWFLRQADKVEKRARDDSIKMPDGKHSKIKDGRKEQFIMTDSINAKKIYDMNDGMARANIKVKQQIVKKFGKVKEQHMPDSQQEMRQIAIKQMRDHVKRGKK